MLSLFTGNNKIMSFYATDFETLQAKQFSPDTENTRMYGFHVLQFISAQYHFTVGLYCVHIHFTLTIQ